MSRARDISALGANASSVVGVTRAWVNANGAGTVSIRTSGNVSSLTDHGTGDYTINFTNSMPDANYSVTAMSSRNVGTGTYTPCISINDTAAEPTTSAVRVATWHSSTSVLWDPFKLHISVIR